MDFHRRRVSTALTPESVSYMLAMFLFERTADVQNGPPILFLHVLDGVCGEGGVWRIWGGISAGSRV